jgi:hypothetical protein
MPRYPLKNQYPDYQKEFRDLRDSIEGDPTPSQIRELGRLIQKENELIGKDNEPDLPTGDNGAIPE